MRVAVIDLAEHLSHAQVVDRLGLAHALRLIRSEQAWPDWLGGLTNLTTLDLSSNRLSVLPDSLGGLTNLTTLDLSSSRCPVLPDWLGGLTNLTTLDLSSNRLSVLPDCSAG